MTIQASRSPTAFGFDQALESMQNRRSSLMQLQGQMASGQRINKPSDDPSAAAQAERPRSQTARLDAEKRMIDFAEDHIAGGRRRDRLGAR
jgi:flagellar hook-associated protein 3 FlgL